MSAHLHTNKCRPAVSPAQSSLQEINNCERLSERLVAILETDSNLLWWDDPALWASTARTSTLHQNGSECRRSAACLSTAALDLRPAIPACCWQPTLAIACSPLDAGQTDVIIDRHDRPIADFSDRDRPPLSKNKYFELKNHITPWSNGQWGQCEISVCYSVAILQ